MSTSEEYIRFVLEQLDGVEEVTCRKMFGEYLVYVNERPVLTLCDNRVFADAGVSTVCRRLHIVP